MEYFIAPSDQLEKATSDLKLAAQLVAERFARWREIYGTGRSAAMQLAPTTRDGERLSIVISAGGFVEPILSVVGAVAEFGEPHAGAASAQHSSLPAPECDQPAESLH